MLEGWCKNEVRSWMEMWLLHTILYLQIVKLYKIHINPSAQETQSDQSIPTTDQRYPTWAPQFDLYQFAIAHIGWYSNVSRGDANFMGGGCLCGDDFDLPLPMNYGYIPHQFICFFCTFWKKNVIIVWRWIKVVRLGGQAILLSNWGQWSSLVCVV